MGMDAALTMGGSSGLNAHDLDNLSH